MWIVGLLNLVKGIACAQYYSQGWFAPGGRRVRGVFRVFYMGVEFQDMLVDESVGHRSVMKDGYRRGGGGSGTRQGGEVLVVQTDSHIRVLAMVVL